MPVGERAAGAGHAQGAIGIAGGGAFAAVDDVVGHAAVKQVRMAQRDEFRALGGEHCGDGGGGANLEVAEDAVVTLSGGGVGEQAEEKEQVPQTYAVAGQVRLRRAALAEQAFALVEHRIVVAQGIASDAAARDLFDDLAKTEIGISGGRTARGRDGHGERAAVDDRRGASAGGGIEALAAEDQFHRR